MPSNEKPPLVRRVFVIILAVFLFALFIAASVVPNTMRSMKGTKSTQVLEDLRPFDALVNAHATEGAATAKLLLTNREVLASSSKNGPIVSAGTLDSFTSHFLDPPPQSVEKLRFNVKPEPSGNTAPRWVEQQAVMADTKSAQVLQPDFTPLSPPILLHPWSVQTDALSDSIRRGKEAGK